MSTEGIARVDYVGASGAVVPQGRGIGMWDFIYNVSATKHREWNVGDRVVLPDGRVYRYGFSTGACWAGRGVKFVHSIASDGIDWVLAAANQVVGDRQLTVTNATLAWTKDQLRGGYVLVCHATDDEPQNRMIVGNNAVGAGTNVIVYLDGPLNRLIVSGTTRLLVYPNPWGSLSQLTGVGAEDFNTSFAGVPAAYVSAASRYFWVQTWGPCWCAMQGSVGLANYDRQCVWRWDGSLGNHDDSDAVEEYAQHAGFVIDNTENAGTAGTFVMLQVCP